MQFAGIDPVTNLTQLNSHKRRELLWRECQHSFLAAFAERRKASVAGSNDCHAVRFNRNFGSLLHWFAI
jgi:hypothetical protein